MPTGAIKDDYPYRGANSGVDRWNFYKGQCTSFAASRVNHNLGIAFHNHVRRHTYSYRKATSGEGSHQFSAFIRFKR